MITVNSARPTTLHRTFALGAAAVLCAGLAACSSSGGTTTPPPIHSTSPAGHSQPSAASAAAPSGSSVAAAGSACGLVTLSEVTTAAGRPMTMSGDAGSICTFSATADASFVIVVQTYPDAHSMALMTQIEPGSEHVAGLGDSAFWANGIVFVHKGSRALAVTAANVVDAASLKTKLITLARAALGRF